MKDGLKNICTLRIYLSCLLHWHFIDAVGFQNHKTTAWLLSILIYTELSYHFYLMKRFLLLNNPVVLLLAAPDYSEDIRGKTSADEDGKQHSCTTFLNISFSSFHFASDIYSWLQGRADTLLFDSNSISKSIFLCTYFLFDTICNKSK